MNRTVLSRWAGTLAALAVLLAVAAPAAAHAGGTFPEAGSEVQTKLQELYDLVGYIAIATSVIVGLVLAYVSVKYRAGPGDDGSGEWFLHNTKLEITWTVGTLLVLAFLGVVTYNSMVEIGDFDTQELRDDEDVTEVVALGQMWQWTFLYPDGNQTTDTLHIQANERFLLYAVSCDVIHSVYVPNLGFKIDTTVLEPEACEPLKEHNEIPTGETVNKVSLKAQPGTYNLSCAEFCGRGHAEMRATVNVFEPGARDKAYGPPPDLGKVRHIEVTGSADDPSLSPSKIELVTGDLTTWFIHNNATGTRTVTLDGYDRTRTVPAGGTARIQFTSSDAGTFNVTVEDEPAGSLIVTAGELRHVELSDNPWYVRDGNTFEPGKAYAIKVWNNGSIPHNLYIGTYASDRDAREPLFKTETYGAGQFRWLNVTMPDENATLDWWCDVPGHAEAGMLDEIIVGAGGAAGAASDQARALLPSVGALGVLAGLAGAAWTRRRD